VEDRVTTGENLFAGLALDAQSLNVFLAAEGVAASAWTRKGKPL
jgi:hypothetical protein